MYQTDAAADSKVKIAGYFPGDTYPPITYPVEAVDRQLEARMTAHDGVLGLTHLESRAGALCVPRIDLASGRRSGSGSAPRMYCWPCSGQQA